MVTVPNLNVLVVEDPFVSAFLRTVLQRHGHKVVLAEACRARDLLLHESFMPDVIVSNRPEIFLEFAGAVHLLYIAAAPDGGLAAQFPHCRVLRKPFRNEDLLEAVESLAHAVQ